MILVSSCLLGIQAKYDGTKNNENSLLMKYCSRGRYLPLCPEQLGGLATPRPPVEIVAGTGDEVLRGRARAKNNLGQDVSEEFIQGAGEVLRICRMMAVTAAILREGSPSCGVNRIYDGTFNHVKIKGQGVTAAIIRELGIPIFSEEELTEELLVKLLDNESYK